MATQAKVIAPEKVKITKKKSAETNAPDSGATKDATAQ